MRLGIISLIQAPYWEPLYTVLSRSNGLTVRVFHLQAGDSVRGWSAMACPYDAVQVPCLTPEELYPVPVIGVMNPGLVRRIRGFRPDCLLIHGYSYLSHWLTVRWAIRSHTPYLLWGDSNSLQLDGRGLRSRLKQAWLEYFCRHAAGVLTIGTLNQDFWRYYGVEPQRFFYAPLAVDNEYFASRAAGLRPRKQAERESLGLPPGRLLLYAGRLVPNKNLEALLRVLAARRGSASAPLALALVGDGPERDRLAAIVRDLRLDAVYPFPFQSQEALARFYAVADALILPSRSEPWGLVVNEAMAAGLPVLLSRSTGCRPDLLQEGVNGFSFDERDPDSIRACLDHFAALSNGEVERMGARSSECISAWTYTATLAGIRRALDAAAAQRQP